MKMIPEWGSDAIADFLRATGVPYVAMNPGASYRGLHDSLVNYLGGQRPEMLICLHEEHAVALAHGYAKVAGEPLIVALHSNVGLMHASMAIYNAWADRVPMLIIGANGPMDSSLRRPWIDWIHSSADQAAMVRPYVKWDDMPVSTSATLESLARAWQMARTPPHAPTYVVLDTTMQETKLNHAERQPTQFDIIPEPPVASPASIVEVANLLKAATAPVVMMGRMSRKQTDWDARIALAESIDARVITDLRTGSTFPTDHPAHVSAGFFLTPQAREILATADVVLSLDWVDLGGSIAQIPAPVGRKLIHVSQDAQLHNGWSKDHGKRIAADILLPVAPDNAVAQLVEAIPRGAPAPRGSGSVPAETPNSGVISIPDLAAALRVAKGEQHCCLIRVPLGWDGDAWPFVHPLDYLGLDGGGGIGSGPGMLVGAALALRGTDRLPVAILGDGDYLMGVQALWTAAHNRIPFLAIVANNRSYFNDEVHQEKVALTRGRDTSRKWIGQRIDDPAPDLAGLARAQGLDGIGPVTDLSSLHEALAEGLRIVRSGGSVVIDVIVEPGYAPAMASSLTREN